MSTYEVMLVVASMGSAAGAIAAAVITFFSARSSVQQVRLQSEQYEASMQPYVWADIRPRDEDGQLLELVVGNSGPTVATNIRVHFDSELPHAERHRSKVTSALNRFNEGHASLAPGRQVGWALGTGPELLKDPAVTRRVTVRVNADGPHGSVPTLVYPIDLNDWRESLVHASGSLYRVEKQLRSQGAAITKALKTLAGSDDP